MGLFVNIWLVIIYFMLIYFFFLKEEKVIGVDFVILCELIGGIYFGDKGWNKEEGNVFDICYY